MNITTKLQEIIAIQSSNSKEPIGDLNAPISVNDIEKIEQLLDEQLPIEIKALYRFANGQSDQGTGVLFGEKFCSSGDIIRQLKFSRSLIKPEAKSLSDPEKSAILIEKIVTFYVNKAPKHKLFGLQKSWYKMEFSCGVDSSEGPYLYATENTTSREREILEIDFSERLNISKTIKELHELEKPTYNWDELKFIVYANGKHEVERSMYDFDNVISFTSTPDGTIQKKYFHDKWLPIFSDHGGNFIGIDLDPDKKGKKGQVINFGRDEEDMYVLSENLEGLFDIILTELNKEGNRLMNPEAHLHETLKEIIE
ncbi:SMI1 / KNR4 family (SUKH-1) [Pedobacter caeni]|uniref:SMI1 / KNR4 family (SUKH-1) n=2 Tax=Pedobacter caeni TaxID=288992 RepID=A0A1M5BFZ3_9SPHI|nr:SMI1 / KNR4 family (SUKH-1) [Pedobacter caeni]